MLIHDVKISIKQVYTTTPIIGQLAYAQAILESNLLDKPSKLAAKYYNFFGIKKAGTNGYATMSTAEYINNKHITIKATFGWNKTISDSVLQHKQVLSLPRYNKVHTSTTFVEAAEEVQKAGYATDPKYAKKLIEIYNNHIKNKW